MVPTGHRATSGNSPIPPEGSPEIRTSTLSDLRIGTAHPQRVLLGRDTLILFTVGHGMTEVDFRDHPCRPGSLLWIRPGQAIRYDPEAGLDAMVVDWSGQVLDGPLPLSPVGGPGHWQLVGEDADALLSEVSQLTVDCRRRGEEQAVGELLRHQLAVLLLRISLVARPGPVAAPRAGAHPTEDRALPPTATETFIRLSLEVERSYEQTRRVEDYASRLGCSVRTLTRACLAVTGRSAKQLVDDRVALQAMRLLTATETPIAEIGRRLGFSEPTNFGRFFAREVGQSPGAFRAGLADRPGDRARDDPNERTGRLMRQGGAGLGYLRPTTQPLVRRLGPMC